MIRFFVALSFVVLPVAAQSPKESLLAADRALGRTIRNEGLDGALRPLVTDDAQLLFPGAPLASGRDRIHDLLADQPALEGVTVAWTVFDAWTSAAGDFGVTFGTLDATLATPSGGTTRAGTYIAAWRHEGDRWRPAALLLAGVVGAGTTVIPASLASVRPAPIQPSGPAAGMIQADIDFASQALRDGAPAAFQAFAAPEAVLIGGGPPRRGPAAIGAAVGSGPASDWVWSPVAAGAARAGDLGFTVGYSTITPKAGGDPSYGKYLTIWTRLGDGRVRYLTDGGAARPADRH
ncbi:MAG: DUF4440 domain-containing protein [Gemmatimonadales bacterium]